MLQTKVRIKATTIFCNGASRNNEGLNKNLGHISHSYYVPKTFSDSLVRLLYVWSMFLRVPDRFRNVTKIFSDGSASMFRVVIIYTIRSYKYTINRGNLYINYYIWFSA